MICGSETGVLLNMLVPVHVTKHGLNIVDIIIRIDIKITIICLKANDESMV